jgi:outer membrane biosynthesis protein TonB
MDMHTPDDPPNAPTNNLERPLSDIFTKRLLQSLAATMPMERRDGSPEWAEKWDATRELFDSLDPRNPADAQLAVFAIAAAQSAMDNFARAAQPGMSDDQVARLRGRALAAGRAYASALRYLRKPQSAQRPIPAAKPAPDMPAEPPPADTMKAAPKSTPAKPAPPEIAPPPPETVPNAAPRRNPLAWIQGRAQHTAQHTDHRAPDPRSATTATTAASAMATLRTALAARDPGQATHPRDRGSQE